MHMALSYTCCTFTQCKVRWPSPNQKQKAFYVMDFKMQPVTYDSDDVYIADGNSIVEKSVVAVVC